MRFASLASGSGGNALLVSAGRTAVLVDCGLGLREAERRLARLGFAPSELAGVLITHEHDDHVGGAFQFAARHRLTVWLTWGTLRATLEAQSQPDAGATLPFAESTTAPCATVVIDGHDPFAIGDLEVHPFTVPHDAREPVQYVLSDGERRLGVLTDLGAPTRHVVEMLSGVEALVLECNHDPALLARGPYPGWLKERVGGAFGHLSNQQAAALLGELDRLRLRHLVAAHLSETNNRPELAQAALAAALGCSTDWICVASQEAGCDWRDV